MNDMTKISSNLKNLKEKADALLKQTNDSQQFALRKHECFMKCLEVVEKLADEFAGDYPRNVAALIADAQDILQEYKDDLKPLPESKK